MKTVLIAGVCMFVALSLVGCGKSQLVDDTGLENSSLKRVISIFTANAYVACVEGLEYMIFKGDKLGNIIQVMDTDGLPKTCDQGALQ